MRIHRRNSSVMTSIVGVALLTIGFQNCSKARFVIDDAAKQKALADGSVFDQNQPGDDGSIAANQPGNDGALTSGTNTPGNDPSRTRYPDLGNDSQIPKMPVAGDDTRTPRTSRNDLPQWIQDELAEPLLIQLHTSKPEKIALTAPENGVMFDILGSRNNYQPVQVSWFASSNTENYFLVLPNDQGLVKNIDQLFGDNTVGPDGKYATQGFAALAKYDDDHDRIITSDDAVYSKLRLWKDDNLDGIAQDSELHSLDEKGVVAIDLRYDKRFMEKDQYGNLTMYKSIVVMKDNSYGLAYDLWLKYIPNK